MYDHNSSYQPSSPSPRAMSISGKGYPSNKHSRMMPDDIEGDEGEGNTESECKSTRKNQDLN